MMKSRNFTICSDLDEVMAYFFGDVDLAGRVVLCA